MVSGLGGAPEWPNRRRRAPEPKLVYDDDGGCSGPFWSRETMRRTRAERRSLQTARGGERSMVGVVAANDGGGDSLFGRRTKRERGRRAASEGEERGPPGGVRGIAVAWGEARECLGGSRRWPRRARARATHLCPSGKGGRRQGGSGGGLGRPAAVLGRFGYQVSAR